MKRNFDNFVLSYYLTYMKTNYIDLKMTIKFDLNNAVFQSDPDEEVNRILEVIKQQILVGPLVTINRQEPCKFGHKIIDDFGNTIGKWEIKGK